MKSNSVWWILSLLVIVLPLPHGWYEMFELHCPYV